MRLGRSILKVITVFLITSVFLSGCAFKSESVDLIIHNAKIYSVDDAFTVAEAIAVKDGKIIAIGPEREILNKYTADNTIDAGKKAVYPGFIDAHCHFLAYGITMQDADLTGAKSFDEVLDRLEKHAPQNFFPWLMGRGWDQNDWSVQQFPDRSALDSLFPDTPVYLTRIDGHAALVNSATLELAGINAGTKINGGKVEVLNGRCTGILIDKAMDLVTKYIPERSSDNLKRALHEAEANCFAVGLTTVDDAGLMKSDIDLIDSLQKAGSFKMRVYAMISDNPENFDYYLNHGIDTSSSSLTVRSFKFYADGALGSRGACLLNPYEDILLQFNRKDYGFIMDSLNHYRKYAALLYQKGFQMNTHCIGDSANRIILDLYGEILSLDNDLSLSRTNDRRWRIEHAQVVDKADMDKFGKFSIIPSVQPTHATSDGAWAWERLGRNRVQRAYVYDELRSQLGMVALGTDFPVEDISPFGTFYSAVYRKNMDGMPSDGYQTENALSREDALRGMTIWAAVANFEENRKGSLEPGKLADLVILDRDILTCTEEQIRDAKVAMTILGGEIVYQSVK